MFLSLLTNKNNNILDLKVNTNNCQSLIKSNNKWVGVPWIGVGKVAIWPVSKAGKMTNPSFCDNGGNVTDFMFDQFNENIVYLGGEDGKIKMFEIKQEGEEVAINKVKEWPAHTRKITALYPNPFINHCILSIGAEPIIKFCGTSSAFMISPVLQLAILNFLSLHAIANLSPI